MKNLNDLESFLGKPLSAKDLFGPKPSATYHRLAKICHPDRNPGDERAKSLFEKLTALYDSLSRPEVVIKSPKRKYSLTTLLRTGDLSDVHLARGKGPGDETVEYVLKISRGRGSDVYLDHERKILSDLLTNAGDSTYRRYLPTLAESFPAHDAIQKRVNVFTHLGEGYYTAEVIHEKLPSLDGRHLAWMFKRLLAILGFTHQCGYVHGGALPPHCLFDTNGHGLCLLSWTHSVPVGQPMTSISTKYRDWYPPEVLDKRPATSATDIYLAAKIVLYLAGADPQGVPDLNPDQVPQRMQNFLRSCLLPGQKMRPSDAWGLHDEFDELLRGLYGKPRFHSLHIPA